MAILSKVSRGSVQEKLHWIFGLYDINKDGVITKKEMQDVVHSIYSMLGRHTDPQVDDQSAKDHVDRIFHVSYLKHNFKKLLKYRNNNGLKSKYSENSTVFLQL